LFESTDPRAPARQKKYLQHFFDDLLQHKGIMCYKLTETLLKTNDNKELEGVFVAEKQKKAPSSIKDIYHPDGSVLLNIKINRPI
jgi:hypothetical protein